MVLASGLSDASPSTTSTGRCKWSRIHSQAGDSGVAEAKMNTCPHFELIACNVATR